MSTTHVNDAGQTPARRVRAAARVRTSPIFQRERNVTARTPKRGDPDFFDELRTRLYTAVLSDVLDDVNVRNQAMPPRIRPLDDDLVLAGVARTGLFRDVYHVAADENPYELEIRILDDLKPGEVVAFGCGGSGRIAPWGELLTTAA